MNWTKLLYVSIIVLIYIPMVFLGANVFFPKYTGSESYYNYQGNDCYGKIPQPYVETKPNMTADELEKVYHANKQVSDAQAKCQQENDKLQRDWQDGKNAYEGNKYTFIAVFNLVILVFALFVTLQDSIVLGLFLASIGSTFGSTMKYFDTRSMAGFLILVLTFFTTIYFINKKKDTFIDWRSQEQKKRKKGKK